ncbi:putative ATP-dependent RNA helicase [Lachancea thermotolerans CBS 6340]|uniref:ATP-dependent RNA helicase DRS1 n=1 Tax=Lachancea thermotolerans (strain ATCC 56472 / CBS 6340 / NRRL Y-8284) TaxID=559295 RepID=C5DCI2_LACTC|nr:KLTH0B03278p [Lachancea thermotolerans CBS 6340]CAR21493.1 KLTH0B03278p [Lachancea thermotolerans CBS 6340]
MDKQKFKDFEDFVPTISDSENEVPDLDGSEDETLHPETSTKTKSKKKKANNSNPNEDIHEDLNPSFRFDLDGAEVSSGFEGWNFDGDKKLETNPDVDLDGIIRRKGGLIQMAGTGDSESDGSEKESESEGELALDGFGMGADEKSSKCQSATHEGDATDSEGDESGVDEDSGVESDKQTEGQEALMTAGNGSVSDIEDDSEEAKAEFYALEEESTEAKKTVHTNFNSLSLSRPVLKGLGALNYVKPSPIQSATIPIALLGKDIIAGAVTGSGKTAAYMIPIIERLLYKPAQIASTRVIVLTPTRELAIQVSDVGAKLAKFVNGISFGLAVGGLNLRQQEQTLRSRPDIVIATPGRLIDHIRNSASFNVDSVEILVIDEADRMLEEGFQDELNEIMSLIPSKRQTLLFSATMNSKINQLISLSLKKPVKIMIDPPRQAAAKLTQEFVRVRKRDELKPALLFHLIRKLDDLSQKRVVVFVARKEVAHKLRIILGLLGMKVAELHGSLSQEQRLQAVNGFKSLQVPVLICTDLASRGLDIPKIEFVINYDMPKTYDIYLHRVGRTARAGREGRSISFVGESSQDRNVVKNAIKSAEENKKQDTVVGRMVDWAKVEEINKLTTNKDDVIAEILEEEKQEKEILRAEMEVRKGENMLKHKDEISARPRRTWFQTEGEKKNSKVIQALSKGKKTVNSKKRKRIEATEDRSRSYKKTQKDRGSDQQRTYAKQKAKKEMKKKKQARK